MRILVPRDRSPRRHPVGEPRRRVARDGRLSGGGIDADCRAAAPGHPRARSTGGTSRRAASFASLLAALAALAGTAVASAASQEAPAARFAGGEITFSEFDESLAYRFSRDEVGRDAIDYLIQDVVLSSEIERRGLVVSPANLAAALEKLDAQLRAAENHSLEEELASKGMERRAFEEVFRKQLACERMVREDLGLPGSEPVSAEQQTLWLREQVKRAQVEREGLPAGSYARVGGRTIDGRALGATLRLKLSRRDLRDALRDLAGLRLVDRRAAELEVVATPEGIEATLARRRARYEPSATAAQGLGWEEVLRATRGITLDDLRADAGVRAETLLWGIAEKSYPDDEIDRRYAEARDHWDGLFGESRRVSWILLHAVHAPNALVARTYDEADRELRDLIARAKSAAEFGRLASMYSNDGASRARNGDLGWLHRLERGADPAILAALFHPDAAVGAALGPIRVEQGSAALFFQAAKPGLQGDELRRSIRSELMGDLYRRLVTDAKITTYVDPPSSSGEERRGTVGGSGQGGSARKDDARKDDGRKNNGR